MNMINSKLTKTKSSISSNRCDGEGQDKKCQDVTAFNSNYAFVMSPSQTVAEKVAHDLIKEGVIDEVNFLPFPG